MESRRQRERQAIEQAKYGARLDRREDGILKSKRMREVDASAIRRNQKLSRTRGKGLERINDYGSRSETR